jgi:hypothetical protein
MAHTFDTKTQINGSTNPFTLSYTCGTGTTLLVLSISSVASVRSGGSPTYNGITMTPIYTGITNGNYYLDMYYLVNPSTGSAYQISIPNTDSDFLVIVASSYKAQSGYTSALDVATYKANQSSTNPTDTVTTTVNGDVIVQDVTDSQSTSANNYILLYSNYGANDYQYALQASYGSITLSWTCVTGTWADITAAFKEVMPIVNKVNIGGVWKNIVSEQVNIGGVWKTVVSIKVNIGGVWKTV